MKKGLKVLLIILLSILSLAAIYFTATGIRSVIAVKKIDEQEITKMPEIDFVQPGCLYKWDEVSQENVPYDYSDIVETLQSLKEFGYKDIIVQMTRTEDDPAFYPDQSTFFYKTKIEDTELGEKANIVNMLPDILNAAAEMEMGVYLGLSVEEYSWWALTCYYDDAYMGRVAAIDSFMVRELNEMFVSNEAYSNVNFKGWYFAYELFSNPVGWENLWAPVANAVIDTINEVDGTRPIMMSPFRQIILGNVTDEYLMWLNFFKQIHFKKGDIFVPQDSMGKLNQNGKITDANYGRIYTYLSQVNRAINDYEKQSGIDIEYWVNVEIYQALPGAVEGELVVADFDRVVRQLKNANRVADKIVTFSGTHYMVQTRDGDASNPLDPHKTFVDKYKELLNSR